jgi:chromate transporter
VHTRGSFLEVLALHASELTSFGGPIAHLGYFRDEMSMCVCQFLTGPASSQVAIAIGIGLVPGCPTL